MGNVSQASNGRPVHLDTSDLHGGGQAMVIPVARENGRTHRGGEGNEISDFECCELRRERLKAKERQLPVWHDAPLTQRIARFEVHGSG